MKPDPDSSTFTVSPLLADTERSRELHKKLQLRVLLGLLITALVVGSISTYLSYRGHIERQQSTLRYNLEIQAVALSAELQKLVNMSQQVTSRSHIRDELDYYLAGQTSLQNLADYTAPALLDALNSSDEMIGITRLDRGGRQIVETGRAIPADIRPDMHLSAETSIGIPQKLDADEHIVISAPILSSDGRHLGNDLVLFSSDHMVGIIRNFLSKQEGHGRAMLSTETSDGVRYFLRCGRTSDSHIALLRETRFPLVPAANASQAQMLHSTDGSLLLSRTPIAYANWQFVYLQDAARFNQQAVAQAARVVIPLLVLAAFGIFITLLLIRPLAGRINVETSDLQGLLERNNQLLESTVMNKAQLQAIIDNSSAVIYAKDTEGRYLFLNRQYERLLGISADQFRGKTDFDLFPSDIAEKFVANDREVLTSGEAIQLDEQAPLDGSLHQFISVKFPLHDTNGEIYAVCGISTDITDRKLAEQELAQSKERFELAMRASNDGLWDWDTSTNEVYFSPQWKAMLGYRDEELANEYASWEMLINEDDKQNILQLVDECVEGKKSSFKTEYRMRHKDGNWVYILAQGIVVDRDNGHATRFVGTHTDITERVLAESALKESQLYSRIQRDFSDAVIEAAGSVIVVLDDQARIVRFNHAAEQITGYRFDEVRHQPIWESLIPAELHDEIRQVFDNIHSGDIIARYENEWVMKDGSRRLFDWRNTVLRDHAGNISHVISQGYDITDIRKAQRVLDDHKKELEVVVAQRTAELEEITRYNRTLFETSPIGLALSDLDGRFVDTNPAYHDIIGYNDIEARSLSYADITPEEYRARDQAQHEALLRDQHYGPYEKELIHRDGHRVPVLLNGLLLELGGERYIWSTVENISTRKHYEDALRESEANLAHAQAIAHIGSWQFDIVNDAISWSDETCRIFGFPPRTTTPFDRFKQCLHPDDVDKVTAAWQAALKGSSYDIEHRIIVGGKTRWIRERAIIDVDSNGKAVSALGTAQDISELKKAELATQAALEEATRLAKVRSEFVTNMSHEIRTPLNAIVGLARMGQRGQQHDAQETFELIATSSQHLFRIVNDILDFSKIEAGKLEIAKHACSIATSIDNMVRLVRPQAEAKGLEVIIHIADDFPASVNADALRIEQVILNLVSNAVKFTEQGTIKVSAETRDNWIELHVEDTGIGMPDDQLERLFKPFEQVDSSTTRRFGGTGLGLSISNNLALLMDGELRASSEQGKGSDFVLSLPLELADQAELASSTETGSEGDRLSGVRLLAAEDIEVNRLVLSDMLQAEGAIIDYALNGKQALDFVTMAPDNRYDAVLMDIQMPVMDGYTATREILAYAPDLPVIGLTAHALAEEKQRCLDTGMVAHIAKPVDVNELVYAIREQLPAHRLVAIEAGRHATPDASREARPVETSSPVIDDQALQQRYNGRQAMIDKLSKTFLRTHSDSAQTIREAIAARDFETLGQLAHTLKGLSGYLEARRLYDLALHCQTRVSDENDEVLADCEQLAVALDELVAELEHRAAAG